MVLNATDVFVPGAYPQHTYVERTGGWRNLRRATEVWVPHPFRFSKGAGILPIPLTFRPAPRLTGRFWNSWPTLGLGTRVSRT